MDEKQKINCKVDSCSYNDEQHRQCTLKRIEVSPCSNCHNGKAEDESMCNSYECKFNEKN